ncbi:helix-turn-helix transcriptional regulator [Novosphingobium piscinae]|uniref:Helix-turn-helix transcriptional regulator n=1 Tax=Novosphingobium piscinae TaxID=1507448 RepID=A0A7X1KQB7_9SPHN|nr:helix-turn-helix transcriptional regulator [Novosphingobium piscinae]MBC2669551.1 helix-turn-helix transcriptional regulator [Novosphingobium piscinae]
MQGSPAPIGRAAVTAELCLPSASVRLLSLDLVRSGYRQLREAGAYRLDLSLDPRLPGTAVRFTDRWAAHRYEPVGRLFVLPPDETMLVRNGLGHQDAVICQLPVGRMEAWLDAPVEWSDRRLEASLDVPSGPVGELLMRAAREARAPGFGTALIIEALAVEIAVLLERHYRQLAAPAGTDPLSPRRLRLIEDRIRQAGPPPTLVELARLCGLSVRHLSRAFRASTGTTLGDHVAAVRMQAARAALAQGQSVKAVAYALGFGSPSSFSFAFRRAHGMPPSLFRRSNA